MSSKRGCTCYVDNTHARSETLEGNCPVHGSVNEKWLGESWYQEAIRKAMKAKEPVSK